MFRNEGALAAPEAPLLTFEASDVTGLYRVVASEVQRDLPAGTVARTLASRMKLPEDVPWALRDDSTSAFLDEDRPIGEQIGPEARVTVTPKTHLG